MVALIYFIVGLVVVGREEDPRHGQRALVAQAEPAAQQACVPHGHGIEAHSPVYLGRSHVVAVVAVVDGTATQLSHGAYHELGAAQAARIEPAPHHRPAALEHERVHGVVARRVARVVVVDAHLELARPPQGGKTGGLEVLVAQAHVLPMIGNGGHVGVEQRGMAHVEGEHAHHRAQHLGRSVALLLMAMSGQGSTRSKHKGCSRQPNCREASHCPHCCCRRRGGPVSRSRTSRWSITSVAESSVSTRPSTGAMSVAGASCSGTGRGSSSVTVSMA